MRAFRRCATCWRPAGSCTSCCTRRTDGPASTCCRTSAGGSASRPPTTESESSSPPSARCRPDIRWPRCCARRRTSGTRRRSPMRCCTRRTAPTRFRSCSRSSNGAGCRFGRWVKQAPYSPHCGLMARLPQTARLAQLPLAEQHAAAELFRGTMARHSLVVYRDDDPSAAHELSFSGDAWLRYVPIRAPDTICVEERLPPGAAAVLINRSHSHTDIYLPIDAQEKRLYDAVDGARTIGELAEEHGQLRDRRPILSAARLARPGRVRCLRAARGRARQREREAARCRARRSINYTRPRDGESRGRSRSDVRRRRLRRAAAGTSRRTSASPGRWRSAPTASSPSATRASGARPISAAARPSTPSTRSPSIPPARSRSSLPATSRRSWPSIWTPNGMYVVHGLAPAHATVCVQARYSDGTHRKACAPSTSTRSPMSRPGCPATPGWTAARPRHWSPRAPRCSSVFN